MKDRLLESHYQELCTFKLEPNFSILIKIVAKLKARRRAPGPTMFGRCPYFLGTHSYGIPTWSRRIL